MALPFHAYTLLLDSDCRANAGSILTLKNQESIHFGYFCQRIVKMNRFFNLETQFMYHDTGFSLIKERLSTSQSQL